MYARVDDRILNELRVRCNTQPLPKRKKKKNVDSRFPDEMFHG